jgi:hypothetical protein
MKRRDLLTASVGAMMAGAIGVGAFGQPISAGSPSQDDLAARRYDRERRFAQTAFGSIAHIDRGTGPAALFLHGFPLSSFQWRGAIDRLSSYRRCIAPDLMGLGYTVVAPGQSITPTAQADMIAAFLDRLEIRQVDLWSTATHWVSRPIRSTALSRSCANAQCRRESSGGSATPFSHPAIRTISPASCRESRVFGESRKPSYSSPKNIRTSLPRRRSGCGHEQAARLDLSSHSSLTAAFKHSMRVRLINPQETAAFGRAVQALHFRRQMLCAKLLWSPLPEGWEMGVPAPEITTGTLPNNLRHAARIP